MRKAQNGTLGKIEGELIGKVLGLGREKLTVVTVGLKRICGGSTSRRNKPVVSLRIFSVKRKSFRLARNEKK